MLEYITDGSGQKCLARLVVGRTFIFGGAADRTRKASAVLRAAMVEAGVSNPHTLLPL